MPNYAAQYASALANAYPYALYTGKLWSTDNSSKYKVVDAKTISIPVVTVTGRTDGSRTSISGFSQNHANTWETKTLSHHRTWETFIHPKDIIETNQVLSIQNITQTMNETQKFPEMDAYLISQLYALKNAQSAIVQETADLTSATALAKFDSLMDAMDEALVPPSGRILYADTYTKTLIDNAVAIVRANGDKTLARTVTRLDEVEIIAIPTSLMKTAYVFTTGWVADVAAKNIAMLLVHPSAILPIVSYDFADLGEPTTLSKGKYTYFEESFEDVFILNSKHNAIQIVVKK